MAYLEMPFWRSDAGDIDGALDMIDALSVEPGVIFEMNSVGDIRILGEYNVFARIADRPEPELVDANYLLDYHYKDLTDRAIRLIQGTSPVSELGMFRNADQFNEFAEEYGWEDGEDE